jgi:predicted  nucleic acid-binding Zn-ribbon protein
LDAFVSQISNYHKKYEEMKNNVNSLAPDDLVSLEDDLDKNSSLKSDSEMKSETFQGEIDEIDSKIPKLVSEIEQKLRQFSNTRYTVLTS